MVHCFEHVANRFARWAIFFNQWNEGAHMTTFGRLITDLTLLLTCTLPFQEIHLRNAHFIANRGELFYCDREQAVSSRDKPVQARFLHGLDCSALQDSLSLHAFSSS